MAELKTKATTASVPAFIKTIDGVEKQKDARTLLAIFKEATGYPPKLWGTSIIGFGAYHYESERSSQKGDWPLTGFSPRKQKISIYIMPGFATYGDLLAKLGAHKISGGSCLYIKKLADIDTKVLTKLIKISVKDMKQKHQVV